MNQQSGKSNDSSSIKVIILPGTDFSAAEQAEDQPLRDILDVEVSRFTGYFAPNNPTKINLLSWLMQKEFKPQVDKIRLLSNKAEQYKLKSQMPCITPSGIFTRRIEGALKKHSGLLQFDIDFKDNGHIENYFQLKEQIKNIRNVAYCGLSASGNGFWGLVPIEDPGMHKEYFDLLFEGFTRYGIKLDQAPRNVCSLRVYSYDSDAYFNHHAVPLRLPPKSPANRQEIRLIVSAKHIFSGNNDYERVEAYVAAIEATGKDITSPEKKWFDIGCALANSFSENGRDLFHRVSRFYDGYSESEANKKYSHCLKDNYERITLGTFFEYCKQAGITPTVTSALIEGKRKAANQIAPHPDPKPEVAVNVKKKPSPELIERMMCRKASFDRLKEKYPNIGELAESLGL